MALNGALLVEPDEAWGRTYVEHVEALARTRGCPRPCGAPAAAMLEAEAAGGRCRRLRTPRGHVPVVEAARDVIAHAWAVVKRHEDHETTGD